MPNEWRYGRNRCQPIPTMLFLGLEVQSFSLFRISDLSSSTRNTKHPLSSKTLLPAIMPAVLLLCWQVCIPTVRFFGYSHTLYGELLQCAGRQVRIGGTQNPIQGHTVARNPGGGCKGFAASQDDDWCLLSSTFSSHTRGFVAWRAGHSVPESSWFCTDGGM